MACVVMVFGREPALKIKSVSTDISTITQRDALPAVALAGLLSLLISIASFVLLLFTIAKFYHPAVDLSAVPDNFIVPLSDFLPEPVERAQYLAGMLIFPSALFLSTALIYRRLQRNQGDREMRLAYDFLLGIVVDVALVLAYLDLRESYLSKDYLFTHRLIAAAVLLTVVFYVAVHGKVKLRSSAVLKSFRLAGFCMAMAVTAAIAVLPVMNRFAVSEEGIFTDHFNAVFHAVVQVYLGKALLVNLMHQYGLYPHFLEPVLHVTGLSVYRFSLLMAIMIGFSMLAVYLFLYAYVRSNLILFLGYSTFAFYSYLQARLIWGLDPYFQAAPIRTFFPFLGILFAWRFFSTGKRNWYYSTFVLGALAILWNVDTGIVVFLSWLLALLYQELAVKNVKAMIKAQAIHVATALAVFSSILLLFSLYIFLRYGQFPAYGEFFSYQRIFYETGFFMLPMPLINLWNMVILVYMVGLMFAARSLLTRDIPARSKMYFFLSILGVGIFSYYQGRSHDAVLTAVWYPAILLLVMIADDLWVYTKNARTDILQKLLLAVLLFVFSASFFNLTLNSNSIFTTAKGRATAVGPTPVSIDADFIKRQVNPGEQVLILSYNSGVYYMESQTTSPLKLPGPSEILLRKELEIVDEYIVNEQGEKILFDQDYLDHKDIKDLNNGLYRDLQKHYEKAATSPNGNIILFTRRGTD